MSKSTLNLSSPAKNWLALLNTAQAEFDSIELLIEDRVSASDWSEADKLKTRRHFLLGQLSILRRLV